MKCIKYFIALVCALGITHLDAFVASATWLKLQTADHKKKNIFIFGDRHEAYSDQLIETIGIPHVQLLINFFDTLGKRKQKTCVLLENKQLSSQELENLENFAIENYDHQKSTLQQLNDLVHTLAQCNNISFKSYDVRKNLGLFKIYQLHTLFQNHDFIKQLAQQLLPNDTFVTIDSLEELDAALENYTDWEEQLPHAFAALEPAWGSTSAFIALKEFRACIDKIKSFIHKNPHYKLLHLPYVTTLTEQCNRMEKFFNANGGLHQALHFSLFKHVKNKHTLTAIEHALSTYFYEPLISRLFDATLLCNVLKKLKKYDCIIIYAGNRHAMMINILLNHLFGRAITPISIAGENGQSLINKTIPIDNYYSLIHTKSFRPEFFEQMTTAITPQALEALLTEYAIRLS